MSIEVTNHNDVVASLTAKALEIYGSTGRVPDLEDVAALLAPDGCTLVVTVRFDTGHEMEVAFALAMPIEGVIRPELH